MKGACLLPCPSWCHLPVDSSNPLEPRELPTTSRLLQRLRPLLDYSPSLLPPLFGYFQVLSSETFPESQDEPGSFPHVHLAHVRFHIVYQWVNLISVFLTRLEAPWWQEAIYSLLTSVDAVPAHGGAWETGRQNEWLGYLWTAACPQGPSSQGLVPG